MNIAIDIPSKHPSAWKIAAGVLEFAVWERGVTILMPRARIPKEARERKGWDAVIVARPEPDLDIPQVCISAPHCGDHVAAIVDEDKVIKLALDQFVSMGLNTLAFQHAPKWPISELRWALFTSQVEALGYTPHAIMREDPTPDLKRIKKPCGILALNDEEARRFLEFCKSMGLRVPGDIHLISIGDQPLCLETTPTLSSISMSHTLVGFHAAKLCVQLIKGEPAESIKLPPLGLTIRDSISFDNDDIKTASEIAHYLRMNFSYPIQMDDLERRSSMCGRHLARIFSSSYGVSPIAYLKEYRLEQAKEMLRSSDLKVKDIAEKCGYRDTNHLCRVFRQRVGLTPQAYAETHAEQEN